MVEHWIERPKDHAYNDLTSVYEYTHDRAQRSQVEVIPNAQLEVYGGFTDDKERSLKVYAKTSRYGWGELNPTHWSFGQLCQRAEVPAHWARVTHPEIAALAMNYGFTFGQSSSDESMLMVIKDKYTGETKYLACATGSGYGRIYDYEVADVTMRLQDRMPNWTAPFHLSKEGDLGTRHYTSDRDLNIFLTDREHPISFYDDRIGRARMMYRGVIIGNSEVGKSSFWIKTFLYDSYCSNRMIFGMKNQRTMRIRHTSGAPTRFLREGIPMLKEYAEASPQREEEILANAKKFEVGKDEDSVKNWLTKRGFNASKATSIIRRAKQDTGDIPRTLWDVVQSGTAMARGLSHTDSRIREEETFGNLMRYADN